MADKKHRIFMCVFICVITSCSKIEGTYVANHGYGYDTLIINSHKFVRIYYSADKSKSYTDPGTWNIGSNGKIYFRGWIERSELEKTNLDGTKIIFGTEISRCFFSRKAKLLINDDLGYYYIKQ